MLHGFEDFKIVTLGYTLNSHKISYKNFFVSFE